MGKSPESTIWQLIGFLPKQLPVRWHITLHPIGGIMSINLSLIHFFGATYKIVDSVISRFTYIILDYFNFCVIFEYNYTLYNIMYMSKVEITTNNIWGEEYFSWTCNWLLSDRNQSIASSLTHHSLSQILSIIISTSAIICKEEC